MNPLKIMIVEDQLLTAAALRGTLEDAGYRISGIARSFDEAVALVKRDPPDLALMDIELQGSALDGISTAREITHMHLMPIIFLTSHSEAHIFQKAREAGPAAFLSKPYNRMDLLAQIELASSNFYQGKATREYESDSLFLKIKRVYEKIPKNEIRFLEADSVYTRIHLGRKSPVLTVTIGLGVLNQYLSEPTFFRLSRSFLINLKYVEKLDNNYLYISDYPQTIPIPLGKKKELMQKLNVIKGK